MGVIREGEFIATENNYSKVNGVGKNGNLTHAREIETVAIRSAYLATTSPVTYCVEFRLQKKVRQKKDKEPTFRFF